MSRFEAIGRFVYEKGQRIEFAEDLAQKLNAYQMRVERLKAEVDRLRKHGDAMAETLEGAGFDSAMDFWNAAKEGKSSV